MRGYTPGRFSFNVKGGRCETCTGDGMISIEMHFLPDVYVPCEVCKGKRYNRETLEIRYKGKSIADVLDDVRRGGARVLRRRCRKLRAPSADAARRGARLRASSASRRRRSRAARRSASSSRPSSPRSRPGGRSTSSTSRRPGCTSHDVAKLLEVLQRLVDAGNTVLVIEHNLDVIKQSDWVIDLGPEGGDAGGRVIAAGTPEQVAAVEASYTGQFLRAVLGERDRAPAALELV